MGQKVNPQSYRMPITKRWLSRWFDPKNMRAYLLEDIRIRESLYQKYGPSSAIGLIEIERNKTDTTIFIYTAKPGILIGRSGKGIEELRAFLTKNFGRQFKVEIVEIRKADANAMVIAQSIGNQVEKRINYRRAAKQAVEKSFQAGAKGIKIIISGRLRGAEIARTETFNQGLVPLANLRSDIQYGLYHAKTSYGVIGIKVWIYKGPLDNSQENDAAAA